MKTLKTLVCVTSFAMCFGAASMASAASISPEGAFETSVGSIVVKSPSSFQIPVTCSIQFKGSVVGGVAKINTAILGGGGLCSLPVLTNIPWTLTATSTAGGNVTNVGYNITATSPTTTCGPTTINVLWNAATKALTATNQPLAGPTPTTGCTVQSLSVTASTLTVNP